MGKATAKRIGVRTAWAAALLLASACSRGDEGEPNAAAVPQPPSAGPAAPAPSVSPPALPGQGRAPSPTAPTVGAATGETVAAGPLAPPPPLSSRAVLMPLSPDRPHEFLVRPTAAREDGCTCGTPTCGCKPLRNGSFICVDAETDEDCPCTCLDGPVVTRESMFGTSGAESPVDPAAVGSPEVAP